ncbi:MAG: pyridoxal 5'-phosphate synthase lyase subunit PdxS, partial [Chloroflexi bacterium]|nr:pyridoxal 5'-phosphate synthase lyase subunit PdxS [Chloroflexota bacterium]
ITGIEIIVFKVADLNRACEFYEKSLGLKAAEMRAPLDLVRQVAKTGQLPVVNFAAGGIATPADAALMMQLGSDGVFVGSGIFKSNDPAPRAKAIVEATTHFRDPKILAEISAGLGQPMAGLDVRSMKPEELLATRGW